MSDVNLSDTDRSEADLPEDPADAEDIAPSDSTKPLPSRRSKRARRRARARARRNRDHIRDTDPESPDERNEQLDEVSADAAAGHLEAVEAAGIEATTEAVLVTDSNNRSLFGDVTASVKDDTGIDAALWRVVPELTDSSGPTADDPFVAQDRPQPAHRTYERSRPRRVLAATADHGYRVLHRLTTLWLPVGGFLAIVAAVVVRYLSG